MHSRKFAVIAADMTSRNLVHESICNCCTCKVAAEMKARTTYDNILRLSDDPDVNDAIRFLRERESYIISDSASCCAAYRISSTRRTFMRSTRRSTRRRDKL